MLSEKMIPAEVEKVERCVQPSRMKVSVVMSGLLMNFPETFLPEESPGLKRVQAWKQPQKVAPQNPGCLRLCQLSPLSRYFPPAEHKR